MTKNYYPPMHTAEENLALLRFDYPDFLALNPEITAWDPDADGELLLALINYAYGVGKNSLVLVKDNEFNSAEIQNQTFNKYYVGGSPKSMQHALSIAILNYHLGLNDEE